MSVLAGDDRADRPGLPINELLAPLPLVALGVLALNDHVLKGSSLPPWLTGKLSDVTGLFVFPLVATAAFDLILLGLAGLGARVDYTLRRWKLGTAIGLTLVVFTAMKLSTAIAAWVAGALSILTPSAVVADPTDVVAVTALIGTWWYGRRVIARIPYRRVAWAIQRGATAPFDDAIACGAASEHVHALVDAMAPPDPPAIDAALARLRAPRRGLRTSPRSRS